MAKSKKIRASVKDPDLYDALRDEGLSKKKSARIANAAAQKSRSKIGKKGGKSPAYEDWTRADLLQRAKEVGITGRSRMKKADLATALRTS